LVMTIYTIGYEKRDVAEIIAILRSNKIEVLADIRINPISRKKGFSKRELSAALEAAGIEYVHFRELGTPQEIRGRVRSDGDYARFSKDYAAHLKTRSAALKALLDIVTRRNVCLLCFERDINQCHRKIVAEKLAEVSRDLEIIHL